MEGITGDHACEMDSGDPNGDSSQLDNAPRSHPQFYSMTVFGSGTTTVGTKSPGTGEIMHINDGTGGSFGNMVLSYPSAHAINFQDCSANVAYSNAATRPTTAPNLFWWSPNNIINGVPSGSSAFNGGGANCPTTTGWSTVTTAPGFKSASATSLDYESMDATFDPLPTTNSAMCTGTKDVPSDAFFTTTGVNCKGAFMSPTDNWLEGWSWLDCANKLNPLGTDKCTSLLPKAFNTVKTTITQIGGSYTSDLTLVEGTTYTLDSQLFMASGTTLTIQPGASVFALPVETPSTPAPSIVIEKGGKINAAGTLAKPITLTSIFAEAYVRALDSHALPLLAACPVALASPDAA